MRLGRRIVNLTPGGREEGNEPIKRHTGEEKEGKKEKKKRERKEDEREKKKCLSGEGTMLVSGGRKTGLGVVGLGSRK